MAKKSDDEKEETVDTNPPRIEELGDGVVQTDGFGTYNN